MNERAAGGSAQRTSTSQPSLELSLMTPPNVTLHKKLDVYAQLLSDEGRKASVGWDGWDARKGMELRRQDNVADGEEMILGEDKVKLRVPNRPLLCL